MSITAILFGQQRFIPPHGAVSHANFCKEIYMKKPVQQRAKQVSQTDKRTRIISALTKNGSMTAGEIMKACNVSSKNLTVYLRAMAEDGLISQSDRRILTDGHQRPAFLWSVA